MRFVIRKFRQTSLKNKIFISSLTVILSLSFVIALFTRWVLISSLTRELKLRGEGIAMGIADQSRTYLLIDDAPELTNLIYEARQGHRKPLIAYIFVTDEDNAVVAHTFIDVFPAGLRTAHMIPTDTVSSTKRLRVGEQAAYDIAVPVREGIYAIGTVHVGIRKGHIDTLIAKLRTTFVGFLSFITILFFIISHMLSRYITRPIAKLMEISNQICRGRFDMDMDVPERLQLTVAGEPSDIAAACSVDDSIQSDEVMQLADSFQKMTIQLRHSQKELRDSEDKYRSLFNSGPIPIFVLDRNTLEILDANPSAEETYGYAKADVLGKYFTDFGQFEYEDIDLGEVARSGWPEGYILTENVRYYKKGDKRPAYIRFKACPADYKGRKALILAATDITEMVEKDAQLMQASKMTTLGEMSAGVAHELNQPLNAIKLGNEYLKLMVDQEKDIPHADLRQVAGEVSNQVSRASEIINRLREFGRKTDFSKERVDINAPVKGVLGMIGQQLRLENIDVKLDLDSTLPPVMAHKNRLEQVLFNLITNAMDAINQKKARGGAGDDRSIHIRTFRDDTGRVALAVTDTGIGIPKGIREKIFEPFYTTKEVGKGMGLGLSIIYGIVKDYGGDIKVESTEGVGSTFIQSYPEAS